MVELQRLRGYAERGGEASLEADRHVAQTDRAVALLEECSGHDADRVGEVDDPRVRRRLGDLLGDVEHDRDRPQRLRQPARAGRLLPDAAALQRPGLVLVARGLPTDPQLEQHRVDAVESRLEASST